MQKLKVLLKKNKPPNPYGVGVDNYDSMGGKFDKFSGSWLFIKKWAKQELYELRMNNDSMSLSEIKTASLRGKIKQLKRLLSLEEDMD